MNHKLKLLAAALAVVAAAPAGAAIVDGQSGNGELFLSAWDAVAQTSYTLDLNITQSAFTGTSNLLFSGDANMASFLGSVTPGNVVWNIVAADSVGAVQTPGTLNYFSTDATLPAPKAGELLNAAVINTYIGSANVLIGSGDSATHTSTGPTDFAYANSGAFGSDMGGKFLNGFNNTGALDQSLSFYAFSNSTTPYVGPYTPAGVTPFDGTWKLASSGDLTYTRCPPCLFRLQPGCSVRDWSAWSVSRVARTAKPDPA